MVETPSQKRTRTPYIAPLVKRGEYQQALLTALAVSPEVEGIPYGIREPLYWKFVRDVFVNAFQRHLERDPQSVIPLSWWQTYFQFRQLRIIEIPRGVLLQYEGQTKFYSHSWLKPLEINPSTHVLN